MEAVLTECNRVAMGRVIIDAGEADVGDKELVADVPINESQSRSASPGPAEPQLPTTATDDASFDLRAILDSDSDLDCD